VQRITRQRRAILRVFTRLNEPLTPQEVLAQARAEVPEVGLATVYRAIRALLDDGALSAVELPGAPVRYEIAGRGHHHHFQCRGCCRVYEVQGCPADLPGLTPQGFRL